MSALTAKQAIFVDEYLLDVNATRAAIRAGYSRRTAEQIGFQLLQKTSVAAAVARAMAERSERTQIGADQVLRELGKIGFADLGHFASWDDRGVRLTPSSEVDTPAVLEVVLRQGEHGTSVRIKLHNKLKALNLLGKHLGLFVEKVEVTGAGIEGALAELAKMSAEQIKDSIAALAVLRAARQDDDDGA